MSNSWRSALAVRSMAIGAIAASVGFGAYSWAASSEEPSAASPSTNQPETTLTAGSFTTADQGACLTWDTVDGLPSNFQQTDCAMPHRFEVASREDLGAYPTSEFDDQAPMPNRTRQAQLREDLCLSPALAYLGGTLDPLGKYSVASILPPQEAWDAGDRTMLCGIQATNESGEPQITEGRAAEQDQARVFAQGDCVAVDNLSVTRTVDCAEPHQLEITQTVDLEPLFDHVPTIEEQDNALRLTCLQAARDYLGGDDPYYYSTLQTFWTTVPESSWTGGSHSVNCALVFVNPDATFGTLAGSARGAFTINDAPPAPMPPRDPIVNPEELSGFQGA
ncbi:septum formation family protein [Corynebacterium kozikiae]|uniref:septum formation family protein n=1 Tax=Corynebacterium kozikiae TaxID=2968469 RepID=UPI00211C4963|nr:septum formation family protein [Corynebacterium sp. 76QC2CO]MCQ9343027.1 septum formation family protein [Corynebacterium sp. 76QC2CO]